MHCLYAPRNVPSSALLGARFSSSVRSFFGRRDGPEIDRSIETARVCAQLKDLTQNRAQILIESNDAYQPLRLSPKIRNRYSFIAHGLEIE
jgi:hypothetical protein